MRAAVALALLPLSTGLAGCATFDTTPYGVAPSFAVPRDSPSPQVVIPSPTPVRPEPSPPQGNPAPD